MPELPRRLNRVFFGRFTSRSMAAGLLAAAVLSAVPAEAERIKGKVDGFQHLRNPVWVDAKDPKRHGYSFRETVPTVPASERVLYPHIPKELCLAALSTQEQAPKPPVLVRVGGGRTTPVTIVVPPKTKLTFKNTDPFKHRLYAVGLKTFTPSDTEKGGTREWTVPGAGVFEIRDELAPSLRMWVVGEPKVAAIGYPSMKGEFSLTVKEPGDYKLQAFFAGKPVGPAVNVTAEGKDIDLSKQPIVVATKPKSESTK